MRYFWRKALRTAFGDCLWLGSENGRRGNGLKGGLLLRLSSWEGLREEEASGDGCGARERQAEDGLGNCCRNLVVSLRHRLGEYTALQSPQEELEKVQQKKSERSRYSLVFSSLWRDGKTLPALVSRGPQVTWSSAGLITICCWWTSTGRGCFLWTKPLS